MSLEFSIGANSNVAPSAVLGHRTGRQLQHRHLLSIGREAIIRSGTVIYESTSIGDRFESGHNVVIREENSIGDGFSIWNNSCIDYGCRIGNNVRVHNNVYVAQFTVIEDEVFIAPGVAIANDPHPIGTKCMRGPTLKRGCRVGVNVTLLDHVTIGERALIGAGSVVTRDVPDGMLAYGSPARIVKPVDEIACRWCHDQPYVGGIDVRSRELRQ
jgi:acetyltransferase-like isoleucine patch superfamily enzyme